MVQPVLVIVVGAGIMGSQIACEYALAGHEVRITARNQPAASERAEQAFALAAHHGLATGETADAARRRLSVSGLGDLPDAPAADLVVESIAEVLDVKAEVLGPLAAANPGATIATNTSSLSISEIGVAIDAPDRVIGTHYWNPPLLMPLVEVIRGDRTDPDRVDAVLAALRGAGKEPVVVQRDVPGFVWNRLQFALLREALALVEDGVADAATLDTIVRDGLARRWVHTGPFQTAALGGPETFATVAGNLFPELSARLSGEGLVEVVRSLTDDLDALARARDEALAAQLRTT